MDSTTQNSGALSELRPAKIPAPDADFFSVFVPELVFALIVGAVVALAYFHFTRIIDKLEEPVAKASEKSPKDRAISEIRSLDPADAEFAAKIWSAVRRFLVSELGNPMLPNMTASEAVSATKSLPGFDSLAYFARELEYSQKERTGESNARLREAAIEFLNARL